MEEIMKCSVENNNTNMNKKSPTDTSCTLFAATNSPLLQRLAEEIKNESLELAANASEDYFVTFDRTHHRHNR